MAPIATLRDDFTDNTIAAVWGQSYELGSATNAETGGQAVITLPNSTAGTHDACYETLPIFDMTGGEFYINIGTMVATGVAATAYFRIYLDASNYVEWTQTSNTIRAQKVLAGGATSLFSATWSSTTYKYLKIKESGGTISFDSSTNGTSWTNRATVTTALSIAVTAVGVWFGASCGNIASPGTFKLNDVNLILPALSTNWNYTTVEWALSNRFRSITIAATGGQGYIATASETARNSVGEPTTLTTPRYFSGPIGSSSGGYLSLTEYSTQADAQAMAVNLPANSRWDLPELVECRFIRLYSRSIVAATTYTIREYYPRRLVQSDDIEAESITAINIAAGSITADKIAVLELDAEHYITAANGAIVLDDEGIIIRGATTYLASRSYGFTDGTNRTADIYAIEGVSTHSLQTYAYQVAAKDTQMLFSADAPTGQVSVMRLTTRVNGSATTEIQLSGGNTAITAGDLGINTGGLNVATLGAGVGDIYLAGELRPGGSTAAYNAKVATVANNANAAIGITTFGLLFITAGGKAAIYVINGSLHTTIEISDPSAGYTPTATTAGGINIYWSAGNSRYEVENKTGSSTNVRMWWMEAA